MALLSATFACIDGQVLAPAVDRDRPDAGGRRDGGGGDGLPPAAPSVCANDSTLVRRDFRVKLFSAGADPSADPECAVVNPERGFFTTRDLGELSEDDPGRRRHSLVYARALLTEHLESDLPATLIDRFRAGFAAARRGGWKVLPRFYYAAGQGDPDPSLERTAAHIAQLTPLLRENADVIAALHAGFLGYWGEWHRERPVAAGDRRRVLEGLLAALPSSRMVLVRRPSFKRDVVGGPINPLDAYGGTALARVGHLNDCFLASEDDVGTYQDDEERGYALLDSRFTAVGGETCGVNPPRSQCASALAELQRHHWSFLNADYDRKVIDEWRSGGCEATIACRLGHRFVLRGHGTPATVRAGETLSLAIDLVNDGFARPYNARPVMLTLTGPVTVRLPSGQDARAWAPGTAVKACLGARLPADLPPGEYRVGIALPDPEPTLSGDSRFAVRIFGGTSWDAEAGINQLDARIVVTR